MEESKIGKENNASSANEISRSPSKTPVRRPVRKRNPPVRFTENTSTKPASDKTSNGLTEELFENHSPELVNNITTANGSSKRRRGRSKPNSLENVLDETHNPPKRPVRRRQANSTRS